MKIAKAIVQLRNAGYHVEYTTGNANVYVRTAPNQFPTTMRQRGGQVSDRTVGQLLRKRQQ